MSVVEFSADSWQASSPGLAKGLGRRAEALSNLAQGLSELAGSDQISGKGADAMRAYISEVHLPLIQSLLLSVSTFQTAIGVYWNGYTQVDTDNNFRIVNDEFDAHLTQLESGKEGLRGYGTRLRQISADASHLVSLGSAGGSAVDQTVTELQAMHLIAKSQKETWEAYEVTDPGFNQVKELISEVGSILTNVGNLTVGRGREYKAGSFNLSLARLGELASGMYAYCEQNEKIASDGWDRLIDGCVEDVEAARKEQALWDLIWDGVQIVAGAVITVVGLGLTPFTGGVSLGLTVLGGSLLVGGVNSAINHVSIATSGEELNLIGNASGAIGQWYDTNVAQPAADSGSWGLQLLAGAGSGLGSVVSEAAQFNVHETGQGLWSLATDQNVRGQLWDQLMTTGGKIFAGDAFTIGEVIGSVVIPGAGAVKFAKPGSLLGKIGKIDGPGDLGKPIKVSTPSNTTNLLDKLRKPATSEIPALKPGPVVKPVVENPFDPSKKGALLPNVRYRASAPGTSHKYMYETNADGLIDRVTVENLHYKPKRDRFANEKDTPGKLPGDEAGHLIADMFDGSPELSNLVSQAMKVNRGAGSKWAAMERQWRDALNDVPPKVVTDIEIRVIYDSGKRPTGFDVRYVIDGERFRRPIPNPISQAK